MRRIHLLSPLSLITTAFALLGFAVACSPEESECACGGTDDCLALCRCSGGAQTDCERECGEPLAEASDDTPSRDDEQRMTELARLLNDARATGGCCEGECFESLTSLTSQAGLRAAAEVHAADMAERRYVSHDTPEGIGAITRIRRAGYRGCAVGENISVGDEDPDVVLDEFLMSYEHCMNVYEPRFSKAGIALSRDESDELFWVVTFGGD